MYLCNPNHRPGGEIGRHASLRGWCLIKGRASSSLVLGTKKNPTHLSWIFFVPRAPFLRGHIPRTPSAFGRKLNVTCPEIGLQIEYEQCKLYLGHQWNRN